MLVRKVSLASGAKYLTGRSTLKCKVSDGTFNLKMQIFPYFSQVPPV